MTNKEWLFSKNAEELAEWIRSYWFNECTYCKPESCQNIKIGKCCTKGLAAWLDAERED